MQVNVALAIAAICLAIEAFTDLSSRHNIKFGWLGLLIWMLVIAITGLTLTVRI